MQTTIRATNDEIVAAMNLSSEVDSAQIYIERPNDWPTGAFPCAKCSHWEYAEPDEGAYTPGETMMRCGGDDCECVIHRKCAEDGLCPHCSLLRDAAALRDHVGGAFTLTEALGHVAAWNRRVAGLPE